MKSSIKVDFLDRGLGKGLEPVIAIKFVDSDDVRDGLLKAFFQSLGGESSWLVVKFDHHIINGESDNTTYIRVFPVQSHELAETADIINIRTSGRIGSSGPINANPFLQNQQVIK